MGRAYDADNGTSYIAIVPAGMGVPMVPVHMMFNVNNEPDNVQLMLVVVVPYARFNALAISAANNARSTPFVKS